MSILWFGLDVWHVSQQKVILNSSLLLPLRERDMDIDMDMDMDTDMATDTNTDMD